MKAQRMKYYLNFGHLKIKENKLPNAFSNWVTELWHSGL
jgi:hypothetical protein